MNRSTATDDPDPDAAGSYAGHPLPLHLDFMLGKGFLWAEDVEIADWLTVESLRMEIPDLEFPFDAGGGVDRFQQTRCRVREIEISVDESGLATRLQRATAALENFRELRVQFLEDALHVGLRLDAFGSETAFTFRAALLPPEPPRADELHLSLYDYRWFGPLPYPGRLLAFEWLTGVLDHPLFSTRGRGRPFQVGVAGDIASLRPFKLLLLELFPRRGWKLPDLSEVVLDDVEMAPGRMTIRATGRDEEWETDEGPVAGLRESHEGRRALAAYESKDLFAHADEALFDGDVDAALEVLANYRRQYGLHPHLASRILDCLLADPTASHLAEARSICEELREENPEDLRAHLAEPVLASISEGTEERLEAYGSLSALLEDRGDTPDWMFSELAAADLLREDRPRAAAERLRQALKTSPHSLPVLERLRDLYRRIGDREQLEDILKRLTGVYSDRGDLRETYLDLARLLMHRAGEVAEARHYLQKALSIDADDLEALEALGESYTLGDKPMRAVKAFASAARKAEARGERSRARQLHFRIAGLWREELGDLDQALLSVRRAISTTESELDAAASLTRPQAIEYARQLQFAAELCEELDRTEEALGHRSESVNLLERLVDADDISTEPVGEVEAPDPDSPVGRLAESHARLAGLYIERDRPGAARNHWERVLELDPTDEETVGRLARHYRDAGLAGDLADLLERRLRTATTPEKYAALHDRLADVYEGLGEESKAERHRESAERFIRKTDRSAPPENPWEKHRAETAPVAPLPDAEEEAPETAERAGEDAPASGETDGDETAGSDERDSSPDKEDLARRLEALRDRTEAGDDEGFRRPDDTKTGHGASLESSRRETSTDNEFDTTSETRKLTETSSVVERERRRRADESGREEDGRRESNDDGEQEASDPELEEFRDEYRQLLDSREERGTADPGPSVEATTEPAAEASEETDSVADLAPQDDEGDSGLEVPGPEDLGGSHADDSPDEGEELAETQDTPRAPTPTERIRRVRSTDDPERLAETIEEVLERAERGGAPGDLNEDEATELRRELAELLYYELEDGEAARPHLERLYEGAPEGAGTDPEILRALETIYERSGETERRIEVLERRLETTDAPEMRANFRLLLSRLYWRECDAPDEAEALLEETLGDSPDHEGAHRLLAELRREQSEWESAARHLERVLELGGSGLDAIEREREYADLLVERLDEPARAAEHYRAVLEEAPGDSRALEGLQDCRRATGDWEGYLEGLGHELAVLLGRTSPLSARAMSELRASEVGEQAAVSVSEILAEAGEIADNKIEDDELARDLYGAANRIWPEHVEALERRIELDRRTGAYESLAEDLERYAESLLDAESTFEALDEAARVRCDELDEVDRAADLLERAIAAAERAEAVPDGVEDARSRLEELGEASDTAEE